MLYNHPRHEVVAKFREKYRHHPIEEVVFTAGDGTTLAGLWIPRKNPTATMVVCHGYRSGKEVLLGLADLFPSYELLFFDFRAHGDSDGSYITFGYHEYRDVIAAVACARKKSGAVGHRLPLIILAFSMGGASALKATSVQPDLCDAMIIDSSFADFASLMQTAFSRKVGLPSFPFVPVAKSMLNFFAGADLDTVAPIDWVAKFAKPLLIIHSCTDQLIPPQAAIVLYAHAQHGSSKLVISPPCRHGWLHHLSPQWYQKKVTKFVAKISGQHAS